MDYQDYKGIKVNVGHITQRLKERTDLDTRKMAALVRAVCDALVCKKLSGLLGRNEEWEIRTPYFKAVGKGNRWATILRCNEHCSRASLNKWIVN